MPVSDDGNADANSDLGSMLDADGGWLRQPAWEWALVA